MSSLCLYGVIDANFYTSYVTLYLTKKVRDALGRGRVRFKGQDAGDGRLALVHGHKNTVTIWV